jgi:subtilase family serine protease
MCYSNIANLNSFYGISTNQGSSSLYQAVFECQDEGYSASDLQTFQLANGYTTTQAATAVGATSRTCTQSTCGEGNLDIQFIMGVAQKSVGVFWYDDGTATGVTQDPFVNTLYTILNTNSATRPSVLSISWGGDEAKNSNSYQQAFNSYAQQVSAIGVTVFVSTGDNGAPSVSGSTCLCNSNKGYNPDYPANSPYVVAVGATMGLETGGAEVVCTVCPHIFFFLSLFTCMFHLEPKWDNNIWWWLFVFVFAAVVSDFSSRLIPCLVDWQVC